jgi:hypothetical protein
LFRVPDRVAAFPDQTSIAAPLKANNENVGRIREYGYLQRSRESESVSTLVDDPR